MMLPVKEDRILQRSRMKILALVALGLFVVLFGRLWYLQIAQGRNLMMKSEMNRTRLVRMRAPRGLILDRNGKILATSRPQYVVMVIPEKILGNDKAIKTLGDIIGLTPDELVSLLKQRDRAARFAPVRVAIDVGIDVVAKLMERQPVLPGVDVELDQLRNYPDGALCAHLLGYIREVTADDLKKLNALVPDDADSESFYRPGDYVGKSGIEKQYESLLRGIDGGQEIEVDAQNRTRRVLRFVQPIPGATVRLTIDKDLQIAAERAMEGKTGAAVAVNPQTGEILAMVSKPDFDPNIFVKKVRKEDWKKIISNKNNPLQNRAISNMYPPGSTFKQITAAAALHYGVCDTNANLGCSGRGLYGRGCWKTHGHVTFTTAMSQSCDVFFYEMGHRMEIDRLATMTRSYGLGSATGIDLPGETRKPGDTKKGTVPDVAWKRRAFKKRPDLAQWQKGETVICAIGQGFLETTPLQMALATAATATGGERYRPYVLSQAKDSRGKVTKTGSVVKLPRVLASVENVNAVKTAMRQTIIGPGGTGKVANVEGVTVIGKTGSAEVGRVGRPHAWFVCAARMENPEIAIAVIAEHGWHGATAAAPVARAILDVYYHKKKPSEIVPTVAHVSGD